MNKLKLINTMKLPKLFEVVASTKWLTSLSMNMFTAGDEKNLVASNGNWNVEKEDILERANWLCEKIITSPEQLMLELPSFLPEWAKGEWAIYSCSMLTHALANISYLYPEKKEKIPNLIARMVEMVNTPTIREYDTMQWHEDAMESLNTDHHHMTYLSILAWMITNYKYAGGDDRFDQQLHMLIDTLVRRMEKSRYDLNLLSFPRKQIWLPDMLVTIVALKNYSRLFDGKYSDILEAWLFNAKNKWIHNKTGLLAGTLPGANYRQKGIILRGSCTALNCSYLSMVDAEFAVAQYEKMKYVFGGHASLLNKTVYGIKEYLRKSPKFTFDPGQAGLVVMGLSAGGTAFALGAATFFGDWETRSQLLRTAELGGCTIKEKGKRHYRLAEFALAGEAIALAMKTNVNRY